MRGRRPFRQSASNRQQTPSIRRARSMSKPLTLWLDLSVILIRSLVQGPSAVPRLNRHAEAKRRRLTSGKMSITRAIVRRAEFRHSGFRVSQAVHRFTEPYRARRRPSGRSDTHGIAPARFPGIQLSFEINPEHHEPYDNDRTPRPADLNRHYTLSLGPTRPASPGSASAQAKSSSPCSRELGVAACT